MICVNFLLNLKYFNQKIYFLYYCVIYFKYIFWIIKNHPHQYVYFNELINKNNCKINLICYWGLSYENFEYIVENDNRKLKF